MISILSLCLAALLIVLSLLHVYWLFGGTWGVKNAIPDQYWERYISSDYRIGTRIATAIVAVGLSAMAIVVASNTIDFEIALLRHWGQTLTRIIAAIFLFRAIGDFRIVGMFKKKSESNFAKWDNKLYIPICLFLGLGSLLLSFL